MKTLWLVFSLILLSCSTPAPHYPPGCEMPHEQKDYCKGQMKHLTCTTDNRGCQRCECVSEVKKKESIPSTAPVQPGP